MFLSRGSFAPTAEQVGRDYGAELRDDTDGDPCGPRLPKAMAKGWRRLGLISAAIVATAALPAPGAANFPGKPGRIAFSYERASTETFTIDSIRPDGSGRKSVLVMSAAHLPSGPAYSANGREMAFQAGGNLDVVNAHGTGLRTVTTGIYSDNVAFSPSGERLVFSKRSGPAARDVDVYTVRIDGTGLTRLTDAPGQDKEVTWSPNGRLIAFMSNRTGNAHVWLMRPDGSHQRMVTPRPRDTEAWPDFAPNGRELLVNKGARVVTMRLDGSHRRILSGPPSLLWQAVYSPDGRRIAAIQYSGPHYNLLVMNADGSHKHVIKTRFFSGPHGHGTSGMRGISWQPLPRR